MLITITSRQQVVAAEAPVTYLTEQGFINDQPDGLCYPHRPITRAEVAQIMVNVFDLKNRHHQVSSFFDTYNH